MARIEKRDKKFSVRWYGPGLPGGEPPKRQRRSFCTLREAKAFAAHVEHEKAEVQAGRRAPPVAQKVLREVVEYARKYRWNHLRSSASYESAWKCHIETPLGDCPVHTIRKQAVDQLKAVLSDSLAPKTVNNVLTLLRSLLNLAVELEWLFAAPKIRLLKVPEKAPVLILGAERVAEVIRAAASEPRWGVGVLYATALLTGMRAGELAGLRRGHIDLVGSRICVEQTYGGATTKSSKIRWVPLQRALRPILLPWLEENPLDVLFPTSTGTPMGRSDKAFQEHWQATLARAKHPRTTFHQCRASFAVNYLNAGGDIYKLRGILGHSSVQVTERYARIAAVAMAGEDERMPMLPGFG